MRTNIDLLEKIQQKYTLKCYPTGSHISFNTTEIQSVVATHPMQHALARLLGIEKYTK